MKYLGIITTFILILSCQIESSYPEADWTLMFYLGDDTYSPLSLTNDIRELTYNTTNTTDLRIIILYDGSTDGDSRLEIIDDPFNYNSRIIPLGNTEIEQNSSGDIDMSDSETLRKYIKYAQDKLPAKKYALYFGSHGTGFTNYFISGLQVENSNSTLEYLQPSEIKTAIESNQSMDLIVFDACSMGNIENVYELSSVTDYIIASPELIPGPGNDYVGLLDAILRLSDPTSYELGITTLNTYYDYYHQETYSGTFYGHSMDSLLNMYDAKEISSIIESESFTDFTINSNTPVSDVTHFFSPAGYDLESNETYTYDEYLPYYVNILDLIIDNSLLSSFKAAITKPDQGSYQWLSIYYPAENYNSSYEETAFAQEIDSWVTKITQ